MCRIVEAAVIQMLVAGDDCLCMAECRRRFRNVRRNGLTTKSSLISVRKISEEQYASVFTLMKCCHFAAAL